MAKKKAGQRKKGKRWQHPSEKKRRKNAWRKILKKAPKMHAFFLAVPESFGGPVFRSRHLRFCFSFAGARANVFEGKKPFQRRDFLQSKSFVCLQRRYFAGRKKYQRFQRQVSFTTRCKRLTVKRKQCNSQPERKDGQFSGKNAIRFSSAPGSSPTRVSEAWETRRKLNKKKAFERSMSKGTKRCLRSAHRFLHNASVWFQK